LDDANLFVMNYEGARFHEARFNEFGDRLDPAIATVVRDGLNISTERYDETRRFIAESRIHFSKLFKSTPVILTPAAQGPAPRGLTSTGNPRMNAPWTALGTPAISVPMPVGDALPLGLQLTADVGNDAQLLQAALVVQRTLSQRT